jgi:protein-disulfide isomerase
MEENEKTKTQKSETVTIKKETLWMFSTFALAIVVIIGAFVMFTGDKTVTGNVVANNPTPTAPTPSAAVVVDLDKVEHTIDNGADITLIEWTDYECPFCARFYSDTYGQIKSQYIETGKINFALEDFPLSFHPQAQKAAEATECAAKVGGEEKFWEMHDLLFESGVVGGVTTFKSYAAQIGLDANKFASCLDSGETASLVAADMAEGQAAGVRGTPGFAIYNHKTKTATSISGAQPFASFDAALKAAGA